MKNFNKLETAGLALGVKIQYISKNVYHKKWLSESHRKTYSSATFFKAILEVMAMALTLLFILSKFIFATFSKYSRQ